MFLAMSLILNRNHLYSIKPIIISMITLTLIRTFESIELLIFVSKLKINLLKFYEYLLQNFPFLGFLNLTSGRFCKL